MTIRQDLLDSKKNRPYLRDQMYHISDLRGIVIHWTANVAPGADAQANRNYFNRSDRYGSTHYIIDSEEILQCIPEVEVAYHVGDKVRSGAPAPRQMSAANYHYIGIELCVNNNSPEGWMSVLEQAVWLIRDILSRHPHLTHDDVVRHYDVTGKDCPRMFMPIHVNTPSGSLSGEWNWITFRWLLQHAWMPTITANSETIAPHTDPETPPIIEAIPNTDTPIPQIQDTTTSEPKTSRASGCLTFLLVGFSLWSIALFVSSCLS